MPSVPMFSLVLESEFLSQSSACSVTVPVSFKAKTCTGKLNKSKIDLPTRKKKKKPRISKF